MMPASDPIAGLNTGTLVGLPPASCLIWSTRCAYLTAADSAICLPLDALIDLDRL